MANKKFYYKNKNKKPVDKLSQASAVSYDKALMSLTVEQLGIGEQTCELLKKNNVNTAADLIVRTQKDMFRIQGFNKRALFEVKDALKARGMALREEVPVNSTRDSAEEKTKSTDRQRTEQPAKAHGGKRFGLADRTSAPETPQNERQNKRQGPAKQPAHDRPNEAAPKQPLPAEQWHKIMKGGKWGYSDGIKTVIPPAYDEVFCFKEGLASVELDGKCGYINTLGETVIPFEYDVAMSFSDGLAMVMRGEKCGYIDKQNVLVFDFAYDAASPFEDGEAKVKKDGKWATLDRQTGNLTFI